MTQNEPQEKVRKMQTLLFRQRPTLFYHGNLLSRRLKVKRTMTQVIRRWHQGLSWETRGIGVYSYFQRVLTSLLAQVEWEASRDFQDVFWDMVQDWGFFLELPCPESLNVFCSEFWFFGQTDKVAHHFMWDSYRSFHSNCAASAKRLVCIWMM